MGTYYPIYVDICNKNCLVIGGGTVALRKTRALLDAGARVRVVGSHFSPAIKDLKNKYKHFSCKKKKYSTRDLSGIFLVIAATDDAVTNEKITRDAQQRGLLINVVDKPRLCNFIVPSIVRRGDLTISISTGGISPALSRMIRLDLEKYFGYEYRDLLAILKTVRARIMRLSSGNKKWLWKKIINRGMLDRIQKKGKKEARSVINTMIHKKEGTTP